MQLPDFIIMVIAAVSAMCAALAFWASNYSSARILLILSGFFFWSLGVVWSYTSKGYGLGTQLLVSAVLGALGACLITWALHEVTAKTGVDRSSMGRGDPSTNRPGATLEANTGGFINAEGAQIAGDLPFQFGRAETGGVIHMPGIKVVKNPDGTTSIRMPGSDDQK